MVETGIGRAIKSLTLPLRQTIKERVFYIQEGMQPDDIRFCLEVRMAVMLMLPAIHRQNFLLRLKATIKEVYHGR